MMPKEAQFVLYPLLAVYNISHIRGYCNTTLLYEEATKP